VSSDPARITLLLIAACAIIGVFAVQHIEAAGSPVGRPVLEAAFSPNGDGQQDTAQLRFSLKRRAFVTVEFRDASDTVVRTISGWHRRGKALVEWDGSTTTHGKLTPEGNYRATLILGKNGRRFPLHRPVLLDVTAPQLRATGLQTDRAHPGLFMVRATVTGPVYGRRVFVGKRRMHLLAATRRTTVHHGVASTTYVITFRERADTPVASNTVRISFTDPAGNTAERGIGGVQT